MKMAYLFGPFVGDLSLELLSFAPHAIHIKKENPDSKLIVYTRPERLDLYGKYADILIPLRIKNDSDILQHDYSLNGLSKKNYDKMVRLFKRKYRDHYKIENHFYPDISNYRSKNKWQFTRHQLNYEFRPRSENNNLVKKFINLDKDNFIIVDLSGLYLDESFYFIETLDRLIDKNVKFVCYNPNNNDINLIFTSREIIDLSKLKFDINTSLIGCLIICLRKSLYTISTNFSDATQLSLLLGIKLVINRDYSSDFLNIINPLNTKVSKFIEFDTEKFEL